MKIVNKIVLMLVLIWEAFASRTSIPIWNPNIDANDVVKASKSFEIMDPFDCNWKSHKNIDAPINKDTKPSQSFQWNGAINVIQEYLSDCSPAKEIDLPPNIDDYCEITFNGKSSPCILQWPKIIDCFCSSTTYIKSSNKNVSFSFYKIIYHPIPLTFLFIESSPSAFNSLELSDLEIQMFWEYSKNILALTLDQISDLK